MEPVARAVLGDPNPRMSSKAELRFGTHGSWSVDLEKGTVFSHELNEGGGVLWFLENQKGLAAGAAFDFMRELGLDVGEDRHHKGTNGHTRQDSAERVVEATYDYVDEAGALLYQALRYVFRNPDGSFTVDKDDKRRKTFSQRRPDGAGGWVWNLKGTRLVPYRLPELIEAIAEDRQVFIVEGEKKADLLWSFGVPATCNPMGSSKWPDSFADIFRGARVLMLPDNDDAGRKHIDVVGASLAPVAADLRVLALPGLRAKGDVVDWADAGGTVEQLYSLAEGAPAWSPDMRQSRFGLVMWADQDQPGEEYEYLIEDLAPESEPMLIIGESQSGKSFLTTHMAMCGARGEPFFGRRVLKPFGVVYCAYEAGKGFRDRMRAYRRHFGLRLDDLPFGVLTKPVDLWSDAVNTDALIEEIMWIADQKFRGVRLGAVVIDTHNAATPGMDEVASKDSGVIRDRYKAIMGATKSACWIIGHKNAAGKHRGNEQLYNNIETAIDISKRLSEDREPVPLRDAEGHALRRIKVLKQREGLDGTTWEFVLRNVDVGRLDKYGKPKTSCVPVEPAEAGKSGTPGAAVLSPQQRRFMDALFEALDSHGTATASMLGLPRSVGKIVDYNHVKKIFARRELNDGEDPRDHSQRLRTALSRARKELGDRKVIGADNPYIWWTGRPIEGMTTGAPSSAPRADEPELPHDIEDFTR
jgi:hypothetical protein